MASAPAHATHDRARTKRAQAGRRSSVSRRTLTIASAMPTANQSNVVTSVTTCIERCTASEAAVSTTRTPISSAGRGRPMRRIASAYSGRSA